MKTLVLIMLVTLVTSEEIDLTKLSESNNKFSARLYKEIVLKNPNNIVVSPFSASTILALTSLGAKGETATELFQGLNLPTDPEEIKKMFRDVQQYFISGRFSTLASANKLYMETGFGIVPDFLNTATSDFGADAENVNFGDTSTTARKINQWVDQKTAGKIQDLISPDDINELTRVILVNALYFKGMWLKPFKKDLTKPMPFHKSLTETVEVPTMQEVMYLRYAVNEELGATFVDLPYRASPVVLTIILPNEIEGLKSIENNMEALLQPQNYTRDNMKLFMPKFKVESSYKMVPLLQKMGVKKIFNRDADLSGISIREGLYVSNVVQKVFIDVNEYGTEAAAATAVISMARSAGISRTIHGEIKIDKPFVFFLKLKDIIIFVGKVLSL